MDKIDFLAVVYEKKRKKKKERNREKSQFAQPGEISLKRDIRTVL